MILWKMILTDFFAGQILVRNPRIGGFWSFLAVMASS
jgi:hypothetical protein